MDLSHALMRLSAGCAEYPEESSIHLLPERHLFAAEHSCVGHWPSVVSRTVALVLGFL